MASRKKHATVGHGDVFAETLYKEKSILIHLFPKKVREKWERKYKAAQYALDEQIKMDTSQYVPWKSGNLDQSVDKVPSGNGVVVWSTPYAQFQNEGKVMVDTVTGSAYSPLGGKKKVTEADLQHDKTAHPLAGPHWYDRSYKANKDKWAKAAKEAFKDAK